MKRIRRRSPAVRIPSSPPSSVSIRRTDQRYDGRNTLPSRSTIRKSSYLATGAGRVIIFCILTILFYPRVQALIPFANDVEPSGDDWSSYHRNAVSVLHDGLSMPVVKGPYRRPGGFGYVYFVAACYKVFGIRSQVVYAIQATLLAGSVLMFAFAARRRLSPWILVLYGAALVWFVLQDAFRFYTFRLLAENLLIFLVAALFIALDYLVETRSWVAAAMAGLLCGACFLVRPNTVLIAPAWALLHVWTRRDRRAVVTGAILCAGLALMGSLLVLRDHVAGGGPGLQVLTTTYDWQHPSTVAGAFGFYSKRILYVLGDLPALVPAFPRWTHWLAAWAGLLLFVVQSLRQRRMEEFDQAALLFLAVYYGPLIAVAQIENYGIRMLMPAMPVVVYLAARGVMLTLSSSSYGRKVPVVMKTAKVRSRRQRGR